MSTYLNLCTEVYELSKPQPPHDAYNFYKSYLETFGGLALEPMCGTGRFLIPMLQENLIVHGFDSSNYMLEYLASKAKIHNLKPKFWNSDFRNLDVKDQYNVIFIPSGSFCLIKDFEDAKLALKKIYTSLKVSGVFVFEVETLSSIPPLGVWNGSIWKKSYDEKIILSSFNTFENDILTSVAKYELVKDNKIVQTEVEELKIKVYNIDYLKKMLQDIGFKKIKIFKAFDKDKQPDIQDKSVVYECIK